MVVAIPFGRYQDLPADPLAGKIVIDASNYFPNRDGVFAQIDADGTTSSELLRAYLVSARVVKAFNAIRWTCLRDAGRPAGEPDRLAIPILGDDCEAKRVVAELID